MYRFSSFKIAIAIGFAAIVHAQTSYAEDKPVISLVRARVKSIGDVKPDRSMTATLEIEYVYVGDRELKGKTFLDYYDGGASGLKAPGALTPFQVDQVGIWTIQWFDYSVDKSDPKLQAKHDELMPFWSHYRKAEKYSPRYEQIVALAEAVEAVETTKPADRVLKLCDLLKDRTPEVCAWAVRKLGVIENDASRKVLNDLAEKPNLDLPIATQVSLDEVLGKYKEKAWYESKARKVMLQSWVKSKADDYHANLILTRFHFAAQRSYVPQMYYIELLQVVVENTDWPRATRLSALTQVGTTAGWGRGTYEESTFKWLFVYMKTNDNVEFSRAAASGLYRMMLNPIHIEILEAQLVLETDKEIISLLEYAIKASREPRRP